MSPDPTDDAAPEQRTVNAIPDLMTVAEVCAVFRRTTRALRDWSGRGWLEPVRIGGNLYYHREDVLRLAQSGLPRKSQKNNA